LVRGGFAIHSEVTNMGASVCSIDGQGCGEGQNCFCQCQSSPCVYWTYWEQLPDGWRYANLGAANLQVAAGDVQGWVWGASQPNAPAENAPPPLLFTDICHASATLYGATAPLAAASSGNTSLWIVALVAGAPLLVGGAWWLRRQRNQTQPVVQR
jgi:hypothetical protein